MIIQSATLFYHDNLKYNFSLSYFFICLPLHDDTTPKDTKSPQRRLNGSSRRRTYPLPSIPWSRVCHRISQCEIQRDEQGEFWGICWGAIETHGCTSLQTPINLNISLFFYYICGKQRIKTTYYVR